MITPERIDNIEFKVDWLERQIDRLLADMSHLERELSFKRDARVKQVEPNNLTMRVR